MIYGCQGFLGPLEISDLKMECEAFFMGSNSQLRVPDATVQPAPPAGELSGVALVVDDEKSVLKACAAMVKLCGLDVITASDGVDALNKFKNHVDEIDIVVMDLSMPNMDGIAAMRELHGVRPDLKVILSSGYDEQTLDERFTDQRPAGFIRKPFTMKVLEAELKRVMLEAMP